MNVVLTNAQVALALKEMQGHEDPFFCPEWLQIEAGYQKRLTEAGLAHSDSAFKTFKTETLGQKKMLHAAEVFVDEFGRKDLASRPGLYLSAPQGAGKTHLATAALRELIRNGHSGVMVHVPTYLAEVGAVQFDNAATEAESRHPIETAKRAAILILDDLCRESGNQWEQQVLYEIVNHRWERTMAMFITSVIALDPEGLKNQTLEQRYGKSFVSRLHGHCESCSVGGEDWRKR